MKRFMWVVLLLALCASVNAVEKSKEATFTFDAADTGATSVLLDTVVTEAFPIPADWWRAWFTFKIDSWGGRSDTNFTGDIYTLKFQHSLDIDGVNGWVTRSDSLARIDLTSADFDTIFQSGRFLDWDTTSSPFLHRYGRFMIIRKDSVEASVPGLLSNSYYKRFTVFAEGVKR